MRNIKLTIQYDGTNYAGWQFQKNARSVQEVIERVIAELTGQRSALIGSGRTDAGVHAEAQIANFKTRSQFPLYSIHMGLNALLPPDIVVIRAEEVPLRFNAQFNARSKLYRYTISNSKFTSPFIRKYAAKCWYALDIALMKRASRALIGRHDFKAFQTTEEKKKSSVRIIKKIDIEKEGDLIYIYIEADGFLYNMVRSIVGTLIEIGRGKIPASTIGQIIAKKERRLSGPTAPARGLCLVKVRY